MQSMVAAIIREGEEGTLPTEIRKVIWDNATKFEKEFQSWWYLVNFTYDPINNKATAFVLTIHNASVYTIYPIIALGLNHDGTILYPLEHRVWAQQNGNKWQTVDVNACVVREQQGFICESNTIKAQDICLDTEQNVCHFEIQPDEAPETVLVYIGKGCVCMRTICDFIFVDNITVDTSNCSNICVCNFTKIVGCDFNYSAPVTPYQLLQSNYTLSRDLLPSPIGMNLTLVKKLLQHDDLCQLLERIRNNGRKTLITVCHDAEEIHHVLERVKKDGEHHWWETLLGWSQTATGVFNLMLHPVVILLTLTLVCLLLIIIFKKGEHWLSPSRMLKYQVTLLEQDDVELKTTTAVNPAMFLSSEMGESLHHDCLQTVEQVYSSRQDLKDEPLPNPDLELFTDGSSFVQDGK
ncbi:hypothetical protein QYF61_004246 [Mycteria americana]|uniref:Uncharacterized protein n=1 Tax=Mycteria americana TaxID=33587 RepID=A0AAN7RVL4_MYCAM|nr:hypothetical protein QYF61_004246 [Mycteria americana]